jgi:hypothetical protein
MTFSPETVRADKIVQTFEIVVDYDAGYLLEELTNSVSVHKTPVGDKKEVIGLPNAGRSRVEGQRAPPNHRGVPTDAYYGFDQG